MSGTLEGMRLIAESTESISLMPCGFDGPVVEGPDEREDQEVRMIAFGALGDLVIAIVYTWRGETRRIISARKATSNERKAYYQALHGQADV